MKIIKAFRTKSQVSLLDFISGFILIFLLTWTILPASAAGIEASRELSTGTIYPGESFAVTVHIKTDSNVEALVLDENLPGEWQINQSENNEADFQEISTFKASTFEWIWVENLSAGEEKTVTYNVTVPLNSRPGDFTISGTVSAYSVPAAPVKGFSEIVLTYPSLNVDFSASPLLGGAPLIVQFTDLSASNTDFWEWDFDGNGIIDSKERNPLYTYQTPGNYTVTLKTTNNTCGNNTTTKTGYITVTEKPSIEGESTENEGNGENVKIGGNEESKESGGSGGGGGGSAGSPESTRNIELKEISSEQIFKGIHTCFTFKDGMNEIVSVEFDPKKNFGKTTAIVEVLKDTSSIVKGPAPGTVYRNINIWVGNSGFSSPENLENARINFRVNRTWITEHGVSEKTVILYRYSEGSWSPLPTSLSREDENYFYFTAETSGFSPFAISGTEKKTQTVEISPARGGENQTLTEENISDDEIISDKEKHGTPASNIEKKEKKGSPGPETTFLVAELLILYGVLKKRR